MFLDLGMLFSSKSRVRFVRVVSRIYSRRCFFGKVICFFLFLCSF